MYSLIALEARSPRSRCRPGRPLTPAGEAFLACPLLLEVYHQYVVFLSWQIITSISTFIVTWPLPCVSVFISLSSHKDISYIALGVALLQHVLLLTVHISSEVTS